MFPDVKIYTKTGDQGTTGLFGGGRVSKSHRRVAAYGDIDELNAVLGLARTTPPADLHAELLESVQRDLFSIGGWLATPEPERVAAALAKARLGPDQVARFEATIDACDRELARLTAFILPGGTPKAAALHLARTVCRRAERSVVGLAEEATLPAEILVYLNRLSDLLFTLARLANHRAGVADPTW
jgi:cob(I)alamin adenosyltransferase